MLQRFSCISFLFKPPCYDQPNNLNLCNRIETLFYLYFLKILLGIKFRIFKFEKIG